MSQKILDLIKNPPAYFIPPETLWFAPVEIKPSSISGRGVFSSRNLPKGFLLCAFGGLIKTKLLDEEREKDLFIYLGGEVFLTPRDFERPGPEWLINHHCDSNVLNFQWNLYTRREILKGEELFLDYGVSKALRSLEEPLCCACGSSKCRKVIDSNNCKKKDFAKARFWEFDSLIQAYILKNILNGDNFFPPHPLDIISLPSDR